MRKYRSPDVKVTSCSDPCRHEAAEVGGSAGRLAPRPRRQDAAQEEDGVQEEDDDAVRSSEGGKETVWEQKEEEVAAAVICSGPGTALSPAWWTMRPDLAPGCRRSPPTRWTCSKLGGNRLFNRRARWKIKFINVCLRTSNC